MTPITLCYITYRKDPKAEWFIDALNHYVSKSDRDHLELLFIDGHAWPKIAARDLDPAVMLLAQDRQQYWENIVKDRFQWKLVPPKPCVWQGPFRLTKQEWFANSSCRNTGFIVAKNKYIVFADDLSVPINTWWPVVQESAEIDRVVLGSYRKVRKLDVRDGLVATYEAFRQGEDSRWAAGDDHNSRHINGGALFGCSFGMPLDLALRVNGFDEACDSQGFEDVDFGIRLNRAGANCYYSRKMYTFESEEHHSAEPALLRLSRKVASGRLPTGYRGNPMSDHVMINRLVHLEPQRFHTLQTPNLVELREEYQSSGRIAIPTHPDYDWRDGTLLADLAP